jgi:uncharacterized repeat protein (TIGR01451 family)
LTKRNKVVIPIYKEAGMNRNVLRGVVLACAVGFLACPTWGKDQGDVAVELTAQKVMKLADGREQLVKADMAKPGETVEYRAVYTNNGKTGVRELLANLPVPIDMEYIAGSARPATVMASLDGMRFAPVPLKRKVKLANGSEELRDIPSTEYRFLRWEMKALAAGKSVIVSARMRIATGPVPSTVQPAPKTK